MLILLCLFIYVCSSVGPHFFISNIVFVCQSEPIQQGLTAGGIPLLDLDITFCKKPANNSGSVYR